MTPQTLRRIDLLVHDTYYRYASWTIMPPGLVWDASGRHGYSESIISTIP
ncbi:hypothetical protein [Gaiella sp.]|jgi:hypothetical protein|nr:hypothetical protein [Gaiella sp.]HEX5584864.1 hypothetical protein [Gaiella sp.]